LPAINVDSVTVLGTAISPITKRFVEAARQPGHALTKTIDPDSSLTRSDHAE
jgi:hypothetical protein